MSLAFAAAMLIVVYVSAAVLAVSVPALFGFLAYDGIKNYAAARTDWDGHVIRIAAERGVARGFVIAGGLFWSLTAFVGLYSFQETGMREALLAALYPLVAVLVTLIVGWYFERFAAALLVLATSAVVAWGVIYQFELGVWTIMTFALIGPMLTAAVLFWLARRDQEAYELATSTRPDLGLLFSAYSRVPARVNA